MKKFIPILAAPLLLFVGSKVEAQIVQFQQSSSFSQTNIAAPPVVVDTVPVAPMVQFASVPVPVCNTAFSGVSYGGGYGVPAFGVGRFRSFAFQPNFGFTPAFSFGFNPFFTPFVGFNRFNSFGFNRGFGVGVGVGFNRGFGFRAVPRRQVVRQRTVVRNR